MADSGKLDLVHKAIRSGIMGHIQWKDSAERLVKNDPMLRNFSPAEIRLRLRQFVLDGNCLDVRAETRTEWLEACPDDPFWYRAVIPVPMLPEGLFIEIKLFDDDPKEPWVVIVSAHPQRK